MKKFEAIVSTIHGLIRFRAPKGYGMVYRKPLIATTIKLIAKKKKQN